MVIHVMCRGYLLQVTNQTFNLSLISLHTVLIAWSAFTLTSNPFLYVNTD